jgi:transposase
MRYIGLDAHREFCEVAVCQEGRVRRAERVASTPAALERFARTLGPEDVVALEATGNAWAIARILAPHAGRVVLAQPKAVRAIAQAKVKTDAVDARTLVRLLTAGFLPEVWQGGEGTQALRRQVSRRRQLIKQRTRAKNQVHAVLMRNLAGKPPMSDVFGRRGRAWLAGLALPVDERATLEGCLREIDFVDGELAVVQRALAEAALASPECRRLMTIPGIDATTAVVVMGAVGDIRRFPSAQQLVGYLGLDPRVRQSGNEPARHGRISKQGASAARHALVEAAWVAGRSSGPLRAFAERVRARRGVNIATVAVARKLAVLCWHMLTREQDYAFARPGLTRQKLRRLELAVGAERRQGQRIGERVYPTKAEHARDLELARQAELAYRRLMQDWGPRARRAQAPHGGAHPEVSP